MWKYILIGFILIVIFLFVQNRREPFAEISGQLCSSCEDKTFNQCLECFNCGICEDQWGNFKCVGADVASGTYNKEKCSRLHLADPYTRMQYNNNHYKQVYGNTPKSANRALGIVPCKYTFV